MHRANVFPLRTLRHGLLGGAALLVGLLPVTALAQVPFFDLGRSASIEDDTGFDAGDDDEDLAPDPSALLGALSGQATELLGRAATSVPATPWLGAPAAAPPVAPATPSAAPTATTAPALDPAALLAMASGLAAQTPLAGSIPSDFSSLPQTYQQQILAVLQQAQQQQAAASHRFAPGSRAASRHERALHRRTDARIDSIVARAHRSMAVAQRRARTDRRRG